MTPEEQASTLRVLADFDRRFESEPDGETALYMVALAARNGLPLPPVVAEWLVRHLDDYLGGKIKTVDVALGLVGKKGRHSRWTRMFESLRWTEPILALHELASFGATIEEAAPIVAEKFGVNANTLGRKYRDMKLEAVRKAWAEEHRNDPPASIEVVLAQYADDVQAQRVKAAIRTKHRR